MGLSPGLRTAVFPVAGLGTRFLPATKAVPKELLPVVDKPLIQYAVHEAAEAGFQRMVLVTRGDKQAIVDHFADAPALESLLRDDGKLDLLAAVHDVLPAGVSVEVAIQEEPLGLGHAVMCAREQVGSDPAFAVILPDDMVRTDGPGALAQLVDLHQRTGASVVGVERIDPAMTGSYGIAEVTEDGQGHLRITGLVEKPPPEEAPTNLGVVGRYLLDSAIFEHLESVGRGAGGEIQLTDAIARLLASHPVLAHPLEGTRYDCGTRLGMLIANIDYAMQVADLHAELRAHLEALLGRAQG